MDEMQAPKQLRELWLDREPAAEDIDSAVSRVLRDARKQRARILQMDGAVIVVSVLSVAVLLSGYSGLIQYWGKAALAASLVVNLVAYRGFYRASRDEPAPAASLRVHVERHIEYEDRRGRFLELTFRWSGLMPLAGILFAIAGIQERDLGNVLFGAVCGLGWVGGWYMTRVERRQREERKARLREVLTGHSELNEAPSA